MSLEQMRLIVRKQLPTIDKILAKRDTPLNKRPLEAACLFVDACIIEIEGDTKDDFLFKRWFFDIYQWAGNWYKERYRNALKESSKVNAKGIARVYGTPFALSIPLALKKPEEPGKTIWLIFPIVVMPDEIPFDWLQPVPNLEHLSEKELAVLREEIDFVASSLRSIYVNLMTAEYTALPLQMLGGSILAHLEKAVQDILTNNPEQMSVAFWEIHLAVEKAIKLFLKQIGATSPNIHDLIKLRKMAETHVSSTEIDASFSACPNAKDAIRYRYGENEEISTEHAIEFYHAALRIVSFYTKALHREIMMNNSRLLLKLPPWQEKN